MNKSVKALLIDTVKNHCPIALFDYDGKEDTYATFFVINERKGLMSDNQESYTEYLIQLDLYTPGNVDRLWKAIKVDLDAVDFMRTGAMDDFDLATRTYRKIITLRYIQQNIVPE